MKQPLGFKKVNTMTSSLQDLIRLCIIMRKFARILGICRYKNM